MNKNGAMVYVRAWARHERADLRELNVTDDGSFYGDLGPAEVEFDAPRGVLIVRGMIFRRAVGLTARPDVLDLLRKAEIDEARTLAGGHFELAVTRAHRNEQEWLNLRRDFDHDDVPAPQFVSIVKDLMMAAYVWRRAKLTALLETANQRKRTQSAGSP